MKPREAQARAVHFSELGEGAPEEPLIRRSRGIVTKRARPQYVEVGSSQKAFGEPETEVIPEEALRLEASLELDLSLGEDTNEEEDPSANLHPRNCCIRGPTVIDVE